MATPQNLPPADTKPTSVERFVDGRFVAMFAGTTFVSIFCLIINFGVYAFMPFQFAWTHTLAILVGGAGAAISYNAAIFLVFSHTWWPWRIAIGGLVVLIVDCIDLWFRISLFGYDDLYAMFLTWFLDNSVTWCGAVAFLWLCKYTLGWRLKTKRFPDVRRRLAIWHIFAFTFAAGVLLTVIRYRQSLAHGEIPGAENIAVFALIWAAGGVAVALTAMWTLLRWRSLLLAFFAAAIAPILVVLLSAAASILFDTDALTGWADMLLHICCSWFGFTTMIWATIFMLRLDGRRMVAGNPVAEI